MVLESEGKASDGGARAPLLVMCDIAKSYPGVHALQGVNFDLRAGEVHALVGENGAGKSTLVRILAGAAPADQGTIEIGGSLVTIASPKQAEQLGIAVIYQEFNLVPLLTLAENVMLGREPTHGLSIDWNALFAEASSALTKLGVQLPLHAQVRSLSVAQQQMVEIAKALVIKARVIVMDEPSAALTSQEVTKLFEIIRTLRKHGVGVIYISHRLEEVFAIADRITVLRDGRYIKTLLASQTDQREIVRLMVGRNLDAHFPALPPAPSREKPLLSVRGLCMPRRLYDVALNLYPGEIVGIAGLVGAGRTSLLRAICGVERPSGGTMTFDGRALSLRSPADAIAAGIALVTEDRKGQGLVLGMSVRENITLPHLIRFSRRGGIDRAGERTAVAKLAADLNIRATSIEQLVRNLSGGNQQKVVLAKWLLSRARLICFDEPTRGIDIGAKAEIYSLMVELARSGTGILMSSSELPEVLGMSMRIAVMREGRLVHTFSRAEANQEDIMRMATGAAAA